ncbi:hypothetical protein [Deinococcus multiflagellatus]|uniref:ASCH domain-containing protein n=1 Tax=Deinococcus multiflagellatus TaxID=1656887 RepID=A0ABW1ZRB8_9DEIO|nr:hypothetical protein [Deinococcus multiflagellatus]MBZ9715357.1 hypothetical protein [Deinococcus multiflagellatus]
MKPQAEWWAISVWEPWASALVDGLKPLENRHWHNAPALQAIARRLPGQRLVIHASKSNYDMRGFRFIRMKTGRSYPRHECALGALIGVVTVSDFVEWHHSDWYEDGAQALVVRDGVRFDHPITFTGRQGFMKLGPDTVPEVEAQLRAKGVAV